MIDALKFWMAKELIQFALIVCALVLLFVAALFAEVRGRK